MMDTSFYVLCNEDGEFWNGDRYTEYFCDAERGADADYFDNVKDEFDDVLRFTIELVK